MEKEKNPKDQLPSNNENKKERPKQEEKRDKTLEDTFPASDPPSTY